MPMVRFGLPCELFYHCWLSRRKKNPIRKTDGTCSPNCLNALRNLGQRRAINQMLRPTRWVENVDAIVVDAEVAIHGRHDLALIHGAIGRDLAESIRRANHHAGPHSAA